MLHSSQFSKQWLCGMLAKYKMWKFILLVWEVYRNWGAVWQLRGAECGHLGMEMSWRRTIFGPITHFTALPKSKRFKLNPRQRLSVRELIKRITTLNSH